MISLPRLFAVGLAALFSAYHVILALSSLDFTRRDEPIYLALAMYSITTVASLLPWRELTMPSWLAGMNLGVSLALPLLVSSQLNPAVNNGYATWYVAAVGTLMVITVARRRPIFAWLGVGALVIQTAVWAGPWSLTSLGVVGSLSWVVVAHVVSLGLDRAGRETQQFAAAEREAAEWQAAQDAHLYERQLRLLQTSRMAEPMLKRIVATRGDLSEAERRECFILEAAVRDEIRGRNLLNDAVRHEVMRARRGGATVTLLDEGGIDDLDEISRNRVQNQLAAALRSTTAERFIIRTVPGGSATAVTVVGLSAPADPDGPDGDEDDINLWLEIPRTGAAVRPERAVGSWTR